MMNKRDDFEERTLLTFLKSGLTKGLTTWPLIWQLSTHLFYSFASAPTPPHEPSWHSFWVQRALGVTATGSCHSLSTPIILIPFPLYSPLTGALRKLGGYLKRWPQVSCSQRSILYEKEWANLSLYQPLSPSEEMSLEREDNPEMFYICIFKLILHAAVLVTFPSNCNN